MPVISRGWGKSCIASRKVGEGRTESDVISNPRNSTSFSPNLNFFLLKMIPCDEQSVRYWQVLKKISSSVESHSNVSSTHLVKFPNPATILSYLLVYPSPDARNPWGEVRYWYSPKGVTKRVKGLSSSARGTEW